MARAVRGHWGIENQLHWVLDVIFDEDQSRLRKGHGAKNMAVVRHFAINLVRKASEDLRPERSGLRRKTSKPAGAPQNPDQSAKEDRWLEPRLSCCNPSKRRCVNPDSESPVHERRNPSMQ